MTIDDLFELFVVHLVNIMRLASSSPDALYFLRMHETTMRSITHTRDETWSMGMCTRENELVVPRVDSEQDADQGGCLGRRYKRVMYIELHTRRDDERRQSVRSTT
jgi:hypothetical protein